MTADLTLVVRIGDPTPPYEQLRRQCAEGIRAGLLDAGTKLPPLRQLAADLGLAPGTVARAYRELEEAGLVRARRGAGTRVTEKVAAPEHGRELLEHAGVLVQQAGLLGASHREIRAALEHVLGGKR